MPQIAWINGEVMPREKAVVSAVDHAHLYGDGIFEGIRIYGRKVYRLDEHLERLYHGIRHMGFHMPMAVSELRSTLLDVCAQADLSDGYIRLNVTRGTGLGLDPKNIEEKCNVMIMVSTLALYPPEAYENGLHAVVSPIRVFAPDALDARLKCIGRYAPNIMAKQLANRAGAGEAIMLNPAGHLAEGTGDNLFLIDKGIVRTPDRSCGILEGITRNAVIELGRAAGYTFEEAFLTPFDLARADEAFLTGTAAEVIPLVQVDGMSIGNGVPGPITLDLIARFKADTANGVAFENRVEVGSAH